MSVRDIKGRVLQIIEIVSAVFGAPISIGSLMRYDSPQVFSDPRDIVDKDYVDNAAGGGLQKVTVTGDQTNTTSPNSGAVNTPYLNDDTLVWRASYVQGGQAYQIDESMLQNGILYGFPDNGNFTFKIVYI